MSPPQSSTSLSGQHTKAVLTELGEHGNEQIQALLDAGIIATA